jgi:hypothetical protein
LTGKARVAIVFALVACAAAMPVRPGLAQTITVGAASTTSDATLIKSAIKLDDVLDDSFVAAALEALGPYQP